MEVARPAPSSLNSMDYEAVKKRLACAVVRFQEKILHSDLNAGSLCQVKPLLLFSRGPPA